MNDAIRALVDARRGYVIAPAGYGKTEAIAAAVKADPDGRHLILTHTHAGVDALKDRLRQHGVSSRSAAVHTLAGFALRFAASYPGTSAVETVEPRTTDHWRDVYAAAQRLLGRNALRRVARASYSSVYVDEYQDCNTSHHALVLALAELLPVRLLGDPLQGVLHFVERQGEQLIAWDADIRPFFDQLPSLDTPHRWAQHHPALGEWLVDARARLIAGRQLELTGAPVNVFDDSPEGQLAACFRARRDGATVAAITDHRNRAHAAARRMPGFTCMEPMDSRELAAAARDLDGSEGADRAAVLIDFSKRCMTGLGTRLRAASDRYAAGELARAVTGSANRDAITALNLVVTEAGPGPLLTALDAVVALPDVRVYRWELLNELRRAIKQLQREPSRTLAECAWEVRERTRQRGRRAPRLSVTRPPLVKGLQFDHALLLNPADFTDARDLYVSLTRGSRALSLAGVPSDLQPAPGMPRSSEV